MSAQAELERIAEPSEVAATPHLQVLPERRVCRKSAGGGLDGRGLDGRDRLIFAGILGGSAVIYGLLGALVYLGLTL